MGDRLTLPRCQDWRDEVMGLWIETHASDPLVKRAWLLAEGKGSVEDKSEHLQELIRLARGIATPLPYDPARREREEEAV
jgi:hypothetical protein